MVVLVMAVGRHVHARRWTHTRREEEEQQQQQQRVGGSRGREKNKGWRLSGVETHEETFISVGLGEVQESKSRFVAEAWRSLCS